MTHRAFWMLIALGMCAMPANAQEESRAHSTALRQKTYLVADLVVPIEKERHILVVTSAKAPAHAPSEKTLEEDLMKLIRETVAPESWSENGGPGKLQYFPLGMSLVVYQTQEVHEEIAGLLAALRRLQDLEIAVEVKLLHVSTKALKCLSKTCRRASNGEDKLLNCLSNAELTELMKEFPKDPRFSVMQAPKVTMLNGQCVNLQIGEETCYATDVEVTTEADKLVLTPKTEVVTTGWNWKILSVVSADRRYVRLGLNLESTSVPDVASIPVEVSISRPQSDGSDQRVPLTILTQRPNVVTRKLEQTVSVPDGATAVLYGGAVGTESHTRFGPPVLSRIPYVSRLFRNVATDGGEMHEIVLVTPRILIREEEEKILVK